MKCGQGTLLDRECGHVWRTNHGYRIFGAPVNWLNFQSAIRSLRAIQKIARFVLKSKVWPGIADVDSIDTVIASTWSSSEQMLPDYVRA
jgi:hypothetical protein